MRECHGFFRANWQRNQYRHGRGGFRHRDGHLRQDDRSGNYGGQRVFPEALTIVHLTNIKSTTAVYNYFTNLQTNGADFDVAGVSYYPYWHGSKDNLANRFEHSGLEDGQAGDDHGNRLGFHR
jgi:hypothetical protein